MENRIGEAAGKVWKALYQNGPVPKTHVAKTTGLSAELANQAIGWLARESKVAEEVRAGKVMLTLKS